MSIPNLSHITVPCEPSTKEVTENLKEKIEDGTYKIGDLIVPQRKEMLLKQSLYDALL